MLKHRCGLARRSWDRFGFVVLIAVPVIVLQVLPGPHTLDDAYITFRYARNLANGLGFVYNPGQPVLGTTTPLYTLWLAVLSMLTSSSDFPWLALLTNAVCDIITVVLLRRLFRALGLSPMAAAVIAIAYLSNPARIGVALGTMETSVDVMCIVVALDAYIRRDRPTLAALFSALAVLVRLDSVLLPLLLAAHSVLAKRRMPWREGLIFGIIVGPWLLFAQAYFGSVIPNSVVAKTHAYLLPPNSAFTSILYYLITRSSIDPMRWPLWLNGLMLTGILIAYVVGARMILKIQARAATLVAYAPLYAAGLSLGNPFIFVWYYLPLVLVVDSVCLFGVWTILSHTRSVVRPVVVGALMAGSLIVQFSGLGPFLDKWPVNLQHRELLYRRAAAMLHDAIRPGVTLAASEIGVLGYDLGKAVIIDTVGLVSPQAIPYLLKTPLPGQPVYAVPDEVIAMLKPDYFVTLEAFIRPTLLESPDFLNTYQLIGTIDTDELGSRGLLIYRRMNVR